MELPDLTVVVCTHNRAKVLAEAVASLFALDEPGIRWSLLIVDNGSTDATPEAAAGLARRHPGRVEVLREPAVGLSAARNAGLTAARGEVIAFLDDDAFVGPGWLRAIAEAFVDPAVQAAGGPVEPLFQGELPPWFLPGYLPYLTVWDRGPERQALTFNEYPRGANMVFRRAAFERWGPFSDRLGRKGRSLLSCEETELCLRIERGGGVVLYLPEARVRHLVVTERLTPEWLVRRFGSQGRSEAIVDWQHGGLPGLRRGLRLYLGNVRAARRQRQDSAGGPLYARCASRALTGYLRGMAESVATVPRYRPPEPTAAWVRP